MPAVPAALADATRDFTGRAWVFEALDGWLAGGTRRMLVVGPAGTGKSTLAARLVQFSAGEQEAAWPRLGEGAVAAAHFCRARVDQTLDPRRVFESLSLQLAERYPVFRTALLEAREEAGVTVSVEGGANVGTAEAGVSVTGVQIGSIDLAGLAAREVFDRFLRRPLEALCAEHDEPVLLLVDSLDEALTYGGDQTLPDVLRVATDDPDELPPQVRILLTSRPDARATDGVADATIDLIADAPADDHDVHDYALRRLSEHAAVAERVAAESGGNFLYARYVLDDLIAHPDRLRDPGAIELPADLAGHYREYLRRELAVSDQRWQDRYQPVLGALAVARGDGLTPAELAGALGLKRSEIDGVLRVVAQYLSPAGADGRLRLYHQSFRDFLTDEQELSVYPGEASEALATYFTDENAGHWLECDDAYPVLYTPAHLIDAVADAAGRRERERLAGAVSDLLTDLGYLTARVQLEQGRTGALERDFARAAELAEPLAAYADALRRESHVLLGRPGDLVAQLANRLGLATVEGEAAPRGPWLRALHPLPLEHALVRTFSEHTETTPAVSVTPDGTRAASASWDGTICLWDLVEGRLVRRWDASEGGLDEVAIAPGGERVLSRDLDNRVALWDAATGEAVPGWEPLQADKIAVTPAWDVLVLAAGSSVRTVALADGTTVHEWDAGEAVTALAVAADGARVLTGGDRVVAIWPVEGGEPVRLQAPADDGPDRLFDHGNVDALAIAEDGTFVVAGSADGMLWAWAMDDQRLHLNFRADSVALNTVAVSSAQGLVLAGGVAGTILLYDLASGHALGRLRAHTGQIQDLALVADGGGLVSAGGEGAVRVWDLTGASGWRRAQTHDDEVTALALSADGTTLASGARDGGVMLWSIADGDVSASWAAHQAPVSGLAFLADGRLASTSEDQSLRVWDGPKQVAAVEVSSDLWPPGLHSLAPKDAATAYMGAGDGRLLTVDLATLEYTVLGSASDRSIEGLAATADGAVAADSGGAVQRWRGADHELLGSVEEARSLVLSPDGSRAIVGDLDGRISEFPLAGGRREIGQHRNYVDALALTEDGALLAAGGWDTTLRLWDLAAAEEVARYTWELPLSSALCRRIDGRDVLVVGDRQGGVLFFTIERPG